MLLPKSPRLLLCAAALALLGAACDRTEPLPETPPRQISESPFHYPEELWDDGIEGETTLRVFVTPAGTVDSVRVEKSSGYEAFDTAAVRGAHQLRFEPARRGDEPVSVWVLLPVQFERSNPAAAPAAEPGEEP